MHESLGILGVIGFTNLGIFLPMYAEIRSGVTHVSNGSMRGAICTSGLAFFSISTYFIFG